MMFKVSWTPSGHHRSNLYELFYGTHVWVCPSERHNIHAEMLSILLNQHVVLDDDRMRKPVN